jgi:hypothetical protein
MGMIRCLKKNLRPLPFGFAQDEGELTPCEIKVPADFQDTCFNGLIKKAAIY